MRRNISIGSIICLFILLMYVSWYFSLGDDAFFLIFIMPGVLSAVLKPYINQNLSAFLYSIFICSILYIPFYLITLFDSWKDNDALILPISLTFIIVLLITILRQIINYFKKDSDKKDQTILLKCIIKQCKFFSINIFSRCKFSLLVKNCQRKIQNYFYHLVIQLYLLTNMATKIK